MHLAGTADARGFRQWKAAGYSVEKGRRAFYILAPLTKKVNDPEAPDGKRTIVYGFRDIPVFRREDTNAPPLEDAHADLIDGLPLIEVAREWQIPVVLTTAGKALGYAGSYSPGGRKLELCVENVKTWLHELTHAADDKNHGLKGGQHWDQEIVAEFGAAILCTVLGMEREADTGRAYQYIHHYAEDAGLTVEAATLKVFDRILRAVDLILTTAEKAARKAAAAAPAAQAAL